MCTIEFNVFQSTFTFGDLISHNKPLPNRTKPRLLLQMVYILPKRTVITLAHILYSFYITSNNNNNKNALVLKQ